MGFDYYYGKEADQYNFYRIPKLLFSNIKFKKLSCEAKVLYGLMLDRMGLSLKNEWKDKNNRIYIYYTLEEVRESLCCGHDKAVKLLAELDSNKGIGLIERKKQGLGKPTIIYVKNFISDNKNDTSVDEKSLNTSSDTFVDETVEIQTSEKPKSGFPKTGCQDFGFSEPNYTDISDTDINENNLSIHHNSANGFIYIDKNTRAQYKEIVKKNIEYDSLCHTHGIEILNELMELILEVIYSTKKRFTIGGEIIPAESVKSRMLKINQGHIEYVIACVQDNTTKVRNIKNYLLTALYNAPLTINHYYQSEVAHNSYRGCGDSS